jgi:beta-ureidopropionase / N-carbamoyl-L-amino-acid hydrolase
MKTPSYHALRINSKRLKRDFDELAQIGATISGGVSRIAFSRDDLLARAWFSERIEEADLILHDDEVGNTSGILPGSDPDAPSILTGSHLDTVPEGGRYDGSIGVLSALECLRTIQEAGLHLRPSLEAISFSDEEGSWHSLFGSMGLTGQLDKPLKPLHTEREEFELLLERVGLEHRTIWNARRDPARIAAFVELHIEQGLRLDRAGLDIGLVTAIVGRCTYELAFHGRAAHAGTSGQTERRDALLGAAVFITRVHARIREGYPTGVVNCGNVQVLPGAFNVVPAKASLLVEVRHPSQAVLADMEAFILRLAHDCAAEYGLTVTEERADKREGQPMSPDVMAAIGLSCDRLGYSHADVHSYAGHDAQMMGRITSSGMIFIPSVGGASHNPEEFTRWEHVEKGANVLLHTILALAGCP